MNSAANDEHFLELRGISLRRGHNLTVRSVDLAVGREQVVALIGPSGAGKTSLLRCVNLLERPHEGAVSFNGDLVYDAASGVAPGNADLKRHRQRVGMVFQHFNLFPHLTAVENICLAQRRALGRSRDEAMDRAMHELGKVGLADRAKAKPDTCSGGEKQRVAIARALALDPQLMLFDEPTSAIDPELVADVLEIMQQLSLGGMTMIVVTHEMSFARRVSDRVVFMNGGQIVESGTTDQVLSAPREDRTAQFVDAIRRGHGDV